MLKLQALLFISLLGLQGCGARQLAPPFVCKGKKAAKTPEESLPLGLKTGFIDIDRGKIFYWFVPAENDDDKTKPLTVWLHGGPGESGLVPLFLTNGPYRLNPDLSIYANTASWHKFSNMLYIDQPVGVGFSKPSTPLARTLAEVAADVLKVLQIFLTLPENAHVANRDLYLFGDAYSGSLIPHVAKAIVTNPALGFSKFQGIGIGGGTIDQGTNWQKLPTFALEVGLISAQEADFAERLLGSACDFDRKAYFARGIVQVPPSCKTLVGYIKTASNVRYLGDYRRTCDYSEELEMMDCYLNDNKVKDYLKIPRDYTFQSRVPDVFAALAGTELESQTANIRAILNGDKKVLIFGGLKDMFVNPLGVRTWVDDFASEATIGWKKADLFKAQKLDVWRSGAEQWGLLRSGGGLTVVFFDNAGQLVPRDAPVAAQAMFSQFIDSNGLGVRNQ